MGELTYETLHWGSKPGRPLKGRLAVGGPARNEGTMRKVSYTTVKGTPEVWEHPFDVVRGRRPRLLTYDRRGRHRIVRNRFDPRKEVTLGRVVDVEMTDGRRILLPFYWVVTDDEGSSIWLSIDGRFAPRAQFEQRAGGPIVTVRGIEG